ncbi:MAG: hypothetical protein V4718_04160 [Pseudomonadota bacterium]
MIAPGFLGRKLDVNTQTWQHTDGSGGAIPDERRQEVQAFLDATPWGTPGRGIMALIMIWDAKKQAAVIATSKATS